MVSTTAAMMQKWSEHSVSQRHFFFARPGGGASTYSSVTSVPSLVTMEPPDVLAKSRRNRVAVSPLKTVKRNGTLFVILKLGKSLSSGFSPECGSRDWETRN